MKPPLISSLTLSLQLETWPLTTPFRTAAHTLHAVDVLLVGLHKDGHVGWGEAAGVYYRNDTPASMLDQVERLRSSIESGVSRDSLREMLPPGGARNALDCALWDLEAKLSGHSAWEMAGLESPRPLLTTFTCGADDPQAMALRARGYPGARAIKLKLVGDAIDGERVRAVREALPDVWLGVDANQGFTRKSLEKLMPVLTDARVALIEQPFPAGQEAQLDGLDSPIPLAADESVQDLPDIAALEGRFEVVNIKLDKCGGLSEALEMARAAHELGLDTMIGNMIGTSLAMAPAFLVGQLCNVVDLDGPIYLKSDRPTTVQYSDGLISCPQTLWGDASDGVGRRV